MKCARCLKTRTQCFWSPIKSLSPLAPFMIPEDPLTIPPSNPFLFLLLSTIVENLTLVRRVDEILERSDSAMRMVSETREDLKTLINTISRPADLPHSALKIVLPPSTRSTQIPKNPPTTAAYPTSLTDSLVAAKSRSRSPSATDATPIAKRPRTKRGTPAPRDRSTRDQGTDDSGELHRPKPPRPAGRGRGA